MRFDIDSDDPTVRRIMWVRAQPNWVTTTAVIVALLVIGLPLLAIGFAALLVGLVVFGVLAAIAAVMAWFRGMFGGSRRDGRDNVMVIRRSDDGL